MSAPREHIHSFYPFHLISSLSKILHIPGQSRGVAADIYDFLRCHLYDGVQADAVAAFSWRIYHNGVGVDLVLFILFRQYLLRFSNKELDIFKMIQLCVGAGIINRLGNNLYALYFLCFLRQKQGDGSDTTVKIPHGFLTGQACILQRGSVKLLGLHRIDLVKGQWGDAVADISDIIGDIARSI